MKKILFAISLFICSFSFGQSRHPLPTFQPIGSDTRFKYDSIIWSGVVPTRRISLFGTSTQDLTSFNTQTLKIIGKEMYLGDSTQAGPTFMEFSGSQPSVTHMMRGFVGWLGTREFNWGLNLNYRNSIHQYYDTTEDIIYSFQGTNGWGIQAVASGHSNYSSPGVQQDVYNLYGKNVGYWAFIKNGGGQYVGSTLNTNTLNIWDYSTTNQDQTTGYKAIFNIFSAALHYSGTSGFSFADSTQLDIGGGPGGVQFTINTKGANASMYFLQGDATTTHTNMLSFRKSVGGGTPWNVGAGTKNMVFDLNGGVCEEGWIAVADHPSNFSSFEKYWKTQNSAGTTAERMRLTEAGFLLIGTTSDHTGAPLQVLSTINPQATFSYDATHYGSVGSDASGNLSIGAVAAIGLTSPTVFSSSIKVPTTSQSGDYSVGANDVIVFMTGTSFTLTLPTASSNTGRILYIKHTNGSGNITLSGGGGMCSGEFNLMAPLGTNGASVTLTSDGTCWRVLSMGQ